MSIASCQILGCDNGDGITGFGTNQQDFRVVVCDVGALNNMGDERPTFERLVGGLMVENEIDAADALSFADEEQSLKELLGD